MGGAADMRLLQVWGVVAALSGLWAQPGLAQSRFGAQGAGRRAKQGEQLGGSTSSILVGLARRLGLRLPGGAGLGDCLVGTGFILAEQRQPSAFRRAVRLLNQPLFCSVWGSTTVTEPCLRCLTAVPVGHQVLLRW